MSDKAVELGRRLYDEAIRHLDIFSIRDVITEYLTRDVDMSWCPDLYDVAEYCVKTGDNLDDTEIDEWLWTHTKEIHEALKREEDKDNA